MLNKRQCDFFDELCRQSGNYRSYEELAMLLQVSTRSIRNYCAVLTEFASEVGAGVILNLQPSGLIFSGTEAQIRCIQSAIGSSGYYTYRLSQEERVLAIALMLLAAQQALTVTQICDRLYVSRATVLNDMERTRGFFQQFGVQIGNLRGYRLSVSEHERRDIVLSAVFPHLNSWDVLGSGTSIVGSLLEDSFPMAALFPRIVPILQRVERQYGISANDNEFKQALLTLALLLRRVDDGHVLTEFTPNRVLAENSSALCAAHDLLRELSPEAENAEAEYLAQRLYLCRFDRLQSFDRSMDIHLYLEIHRFLSEVGRELQCNLTEDQQLIIMLTRHLQGIKSRYTGGDLRAFEERLVEEYRPYYDAVKRHVGSLETALGHKCSYSELCSILLHIVSAIARKDRLKPRPRVCVVCHIGIGTAHFLAERLAETFNLEIAGVTAIHNLEHALLDGHFDLIVSTVPLKMEGYPCICISPNLADADVLAVQAALAQLHKRRRSLQMPAECGASPRFPALVQPEHVITDVPCTDWRDALRICGAPLLAENAIRAEYIDAVIRSVETNGPYFVFTPHVALAHAAPTDGVERFCCAVCRPETPVVFHHPSNDPVKLVVLVGITDIKTQIREISALMNLMANDAMLTHLLEAHDERELARIINDNLAKEH